MVKTAAERKTAERERKAALEQAIRCAFCGGLFKADTEIETLQAHVVKCDQHPMYAVIAREKALRAALEAINIPLIPDEAGNFWLRVGPDEGERVDIRLAGVDPIMAESMAMWLNQRVIALRP